MKFLLSKSIPNMLCHCIFGIDLTHSSWSSCKICMYLLTNFWWSSANILFEYRVKTVLIWYCTNDVLWWAYDANYDTCLAFCDPQLDSSMSLIASNQASESTHSLLFYDVKLCELCAHILRRMSTVFRTYSEDHLSHYPKICCSWKLIWHFYIICMIKHFYSVCSVKLQRPHNAYTHYRNVFSDIYAVFVVFINFHAWNLIKNTWQHITPMSLIFSAFFFLVFDTLFKNKSTSSLVKYGFFSVFFFKQKLNYSCIHTYTDMCGNKSLTAFIMHC